LFDGSFVMVSMLRLNRCCLQGTPDSDEVGYYTGKMPRGYLLLLASHMVAQGPIGMYTPLAMFEHVVSTGRCPLNYSTM